MTIDQKAVAARKLMEAGEIVGRLMSREDAKKLEKLARYTAGEARALRGVKETMYGRICCVAGTIMDDLRERRATMDEIEAVAEGFAGMGLSCIPDDDLRFFRMGFWKTKNLDKAAAEVACEKAVA